MVVGRVPLPEPGYKDWDGTARSIDAKKGAPLLVTLWSRTCAPCLRELGEWAREAKTIRAAGLDILALSVDGLANDRDGEIPAARQVLQRAEFPFDSGRATNELVRDLEIVHRTIVELQSPLPVPSSFLLDADGRLGAIYKGPVPLARLLADVKLLGSSPEARRDSAVPYPGRFASQPFPANPEPVARALELDGRPEAAAAYRRTMRGPRASHRLRNVRVSCVRSSARRTTR